MQEVAVHVLVDFHNSSLIATSVAVVRSREDSHDVALMTPIVAIHHELMGTSNPGEAVSMVELLRDVLAERVASTTGRNTPTATIIGVRPEQIADRALMGNLLHAIELSDLVEGIDRRGETTMETEDLVFNNSGKWQVIEKFSEDLPDVGIAVFAKTFIVEAVHLSNLARFVITTKNSEAGLIAYLQSD